MRTPLLLGALAVALAVPAPFAGAGTARPRVSLVASPARVLVRGPAARRVELRNAGATAVTVDATRTRLGRRPAATWLRVVPHRLLLRPGAKAAITIRVVPPRRAAPGDHHALVMLTTRSLRGARIAVRMRLGVLVRERVPGRIVHRLRLGGIRVRRRGRARVLALSLANRGNVTEELPRGRVVVALVRRGRVVARLRPGGRPLLPLARTTLAARYRGRLRGQATAVVTIAGAGRSRHRIRL